LRIARAGVVALVAMAFAASCADRPPAAHFRAVLDELRAPAGWELAAEIVREPDSQANNCEFIVNPDCPSVHRYYLVSGMPIEAYAPGRQMLVDARFEIRDEFRPECDGGETGSVACRIEAGRGDDAVTIRVFDPGRDVNELGIARDDRFIVAVMAFPAWQEENVQ
jgi:hypothetical protein